MNELLQTINILLLGIKKDIILLEAAHIELASMSENYNKWCLEESEHYDKLCQRINEEIEFYEIAL